MKLVILCGGEGTRLREETHAVPKPLLEVGGRPLVWHIMKLYSHFGISDFVLALGYRSRTFKEYFLDYDASHRDVTVRLGTGGSVEYRTKHAEEGWTITLAETGRHTQTGARIARVKHYLDGDDFCVTYGDGIGDVDIAGLIRFHRSHGKLGTATAVRHPERFGEMAIEEQFVRRFSEKPDRPDTHINGGFFVFKRAFIERYLCEDAECVLEQAPLRRLAADGQFMAWPHDRFWQCMDTYREWQAIERQWERGAPWKLW